MSCELCHEGCGGKCKEALKNMSDDYLEDFYKLVYDERLRRINQKMAEQEEERSNRRYEVFFGKNINLEASSFVYADSEKEALELAEAEIERDEGMNYLDWDGDYDERPYVLEVIKCRP